MRKARSPANDVSRREFLLRSLAVAGGAATVAAAARPAKEVELIVWANFNEIHRYIVDLAPKYTQQNPSIKINCTLFAQRALDEKVAVALPAARPRHHRLRFDTGAAVHRVRAVRPARCGEFRQEEHAGCGLQGVLHGQGELHTFPFYVVTSALYYNTITSPRQGSRSAQEPGRGGRIRQEAGQADPRGNITRAGLDLRVAGGGFGLTEKFWSW